MTIVHLQKGLNCYNPVEKSLQYHLKVEARFGGYFEIPADSYNPWRKQYDPERFARTLLRSKEPTANFHLGIVDVDIYALGMNYIFGIANPLLGSAVVSLFRLTGPRLEERLGKEAIHETGHLLGLTHCDSPRCVMYFSNTINDTDKKDMSLCMQCRRKIEE